MTAKGQAIYVHSKLMIVDDRMMRVGSSNFNNRSMRFDNECDVAFEAGGADALKAKLANLRNDLLGEHLGVDVETIRDVVDRQGSVIAAIEALRLPRGLGEAGSKRTLIPYETPELEDLAQWMADNEILDPEGPEEVFEPIEKRGLFRGRLKMPFQQSRT